MLTNVRINPVPNALILSCELMVLPLAGPQILPTPNAETRLNQPAAATTSNRCASNIWEESAAPGPSSNAALVGTNCRQNVNYGDRRSGV